jgi:hypothetical protein
MLEVKEEGIAKFMGFDKLDRIPISHQFFSPVIQPHLDPSFLYCIQMLALISSLYAIRPEYYDELVRQLKHLLDRLPESIPLYIWCEEPPFVSDRIHFLTAPLESFTTYSSLMTPTLVLPIHRTEAKDTREFMALTNAKIEMVWRAVPYISSSITHVGWIDAGIAKIFRHPPQTTRDSFASLLSRLSSFIKNAMYLPGCYSSPTVPSESVCWRFCGGFFFLPCSAVSDMYALLTDTVRHWIQKGCTSWEVNIWAAAEVQCPDRFVWWSADHNDSMVCVPFVERTL